ncbi:hypothetical protein [Streptomyces sp. NPDC088752]|uniref:hypothetical protein n=1 Tax=Streptomyces sp. NPDC088752 TaxID=3154963 RepID=UPI003417D79B
MTTTDKTRLRKVDTSSEYGAVATYEVVRDGKVLGTVTKFADPGHTMTGNRDGVLRNVSWGNSREAGISHDTRKDALRSLERMTGVTS